MLEIKDDITLDRTIFGYFDRCFQANEVLARHIFSLNLLNVEICLGFLYRKKYREKIAGRETFLVLFSEYLVDMT